MSLPVGLWVDLIFTPFLNLDELIYVKRTCRTFCFYLRFQALVEQRIKERFGDIPCRCWNKVERCSMLAITQKSIQTQFVLTYAYLDKRKTKCGVFSTKRRLKQACEKYLTEQYGVRKLMYIHVYPTCLSFAEGDQVVSIYGIKDKLINCIKHGLHKEFEENGGDESLWKLPEDCFNRQWSDGSFKLETGPFAEEKMLFKLQKMVKQTHNVEFTITKDNDVYFRIN